MEDTKNNVVKILITILIIAIIAGGILYYLKNKGQANPAVQNNVAVNNTAKNGENLEDAGMQKIDVDDLISKIKPEYKKDKKFQECIGMDMGIKSCLRDLITAKVKAEDNVNLCNDLFDGKDSCRADYYANKAEKTNNASLCDKSPEKDSCLTRVYTKQARETGNASLCDKLTDYNKQSCKRDVIRTLALKQKKPELCEQLVVKRTEGVEEGGKATIYEDRADADMCKEEVKMEIQMREEEEKRQKEEEAMIKEEEAAMKATTEENTTEEEPVEDVTEETTTEEPAV